MPCRKAGDVWSVWTMNHQGVHFFRLTGNNRQCYDSADREIPCGLKSSDCLQPVITSERYSDTPCTQRWRGGRAASC